MRTYVTRKAVSDHGFKPMHRFVEGHTDGDGFHTSTIEMQAGGIVYVRCALPRINKLWQIYFLPSGDYLISEQALEEPTKEPIGSAQTQYGGAVEEAFLRAGSFADTTEETLTETPDSKAFHSVTEARKPQPGEPSALESLLAASVELNERNAKRRGKK